MAMLMRAELARPGMQFCRDEQYNQLFTMHGTIMLLLFATPLFVGFANVIMPLQIGSPDVAFPRLNMLSYWLFLFGGLIALSRLPHPGRRRRLRLVRLRAADQTRSTRRASAPTCGSWAWRCPGLGTILGARQLHHHDHLHARARHDDVPDADLHLEHPAHQSMLVLMAFPVLAAALLVLEADRKFGAHVFDAGQRRRRSCGSTCSGSSAIPRSTSSRCRSSASSPRSSRCSAASRSSATRAWSSRRSRSPACR